MDVALEDALVEDPDVDALVVRFVDVRCLTDADFFVGDHLALDVEPYVAEILLDDLLVLDEADVLDDLVVCDDLVYDGILDDLGCSLHVGVSPRWSPW